MQVYDFQFRQVHQYASHALCVSKYNSAYASSSSMRLSMAAYLTFLPKRSNGPRLDPCRPCHVTGRYQSIRAVPPVSSPFNW